MLAYLHFQPAPYHDSTILYLLFLQNLKIYQLHLFFEQQYMRLLYLDLTIISFFSHHHLMSKCQSYQYGDPYTNFVIAFSSDVVSNKYFRDLYWQNQILDQLFCHRNLEYTQLQYFFVSITILQRFHLHIFLLLQLNPFRTYLCLYHI